MDRHICCSRTVTAKGLSLLRNRVSILIVDSTELNGALSITIEAEVDDTSDDNGWRAAYRIKVEGGRKGIKEVNSLWHLLSN